MARQRSSEIDYLSAIAEDLDATPCVPHTAMGEFRPNLFCNRPVSIHACRHQITCRLCWWRCDILSRIAWLRKNAA